MQHPILRVLIRTVPILGALAVIAMHADAQSTPPRVDTDAACDYRSCALNITPEWNGLAVVRGADGPQVTNLYFLWPRDITHAFRDDVTHAASGDSATSSARAAVRLRRIGALLTDTGLALALTAAVDASHGEHRGRWNRGLVVAAGAAVGISVPLHFAADGALSRAVWWYNLRFGRGVQ